VGRCCETPPPWPYVGACVVVGVRLGLGGVLALGWGVALGWGKVTVLRLAGGPLVAAAWARASCSSSSSAAMRWAYRETGEVGLAGRWLGAIGAKWTVRGGGLDGLTCVDEGVKDGRGDDTF
jgi:hypothetical protein